MVERRTTTRRATDLAQIKMLHLGEVMQMCAIGRTSVYDGVNRGDFPSPVQLLTRAPRWVNHDIQRWLALHISASRRD
ncbi:AlpA family phage regulatory protein [Duganella sp. FT135W]|uniref:AlpA family phage regulatory protein n=1 Tax=Duganella flavida TaxID=2692175 RepID=A0A6L8KFU3_9BURK|nr:AlpA family phage regulatory protein [Duganella flavida]MYM25975.1 AlpA family phage regulatory protein [Duganella flavida]